MITRDKLQAFISEQNRPSIYCKYKTRLEIEKICQQDFFSQFFPLTIQAKTFTDNIIMEKCLLINVCLWTLRSSSPVRYVTHASKDGEFVCTLGLKL